MHTLAAIPLLHDKPFVWLLHGCVCVWFEDAFHLGVLHVVGKQVITVLCACNLG